MFALFQGKIFFEKIMSYTLGSILFEEHISGEKNIEMHVHIGAKENEKQKNKKIFVI